MADEVAARFSGLPTEIPPIGPEFAAPTCSFDVVHVAAAQPYKRHDILLDALEPAPRRLSAVSVIGHGNWAKRSGWTLRRGGSMSILPARRIHARRHAASSGFNAARSIFLQRAGSFRSPGRLNLEFSSWSYSVRGMPSSNDGHGRSIRKLDAYFHREPGASPVHHAVIALAASLGFTARSTDLISTVPLMCRSGAGLLFAAAFPFSLSGQEGNHDSIDQGSGRCLRQFP